MKITVVYGPPACGKTRNAQKIMEHLGCDVSMDTEDLTRLTPEGFAEHLLLFCHTLTEAQKAAPQGRYMSFYSIDLPECDIRQSQHFVAARDLVQLNGKASASYIQRSLGIGYNLAAEIIEQLEADGIVSKPNSTGRRTVITPPTPKQGAAQ